MKNLETYLAPQADIVYYFSTNRLCVNDASNPDPTTPEEEGGGVVLPDVTIG